MYNFLYCFDENYNIPASCSIFSLLETFDEKINIYIMHKNFSTSDFLPKKILNHNMLNEVNVSKVNLKGLEFPNILGTHVSEATYYRLFLQDYLVDDIDTITYLDCDVFSINNPKSYIKKTVSKMSENNNIISVAPENTLFDYGRKQLKLKSDKYFNAGVMIINLKEWKKSNLKASFINVLNEFEENLLFWDQDVLNITFDGNYEILDKNMNYKVDMEADNTSYKIDEQMESEIRLLHFSGKFKPWTVKGAINDNAEYFQNIYRELFNKKYYFSFNYKVNALNDLKQTISNKTIFNSKYPVYFFMYTLKKLIKK